MSISVMEAAPLLCNFNDDVGDHVGSFIPAVGRVAQVAVDLAQLQHLDHVRDVLRAAEEIGQGFAVDPLHPVLERLGALGMVVGNRRMLLERIDRHEQFISRILSREAMFCMNGVGATFKISSSLTVL